MGWGDGLFWYKLSTSEVSWPSASPSEPCLGWEVLWQRKYRLWTLTVTELPGKPTFLHWLHLFWVMGHSVKSCAALLRPLKPICGTSYSPNPHLLRKTRFITRLAQ